MKSRQYLIDHPAYALDKAKGALCGLAIGDSLGDAGRQADVQNNYGISLDFSSQDAWSTDDTEFALLTAQALIQSQGKLDSNRIANLWMEHVVSETNLKRGGLGSTEAAWNLRRGLRPPDSGRFTAHGYSDGAAMRCCPIGIICAGEPQRAARLAEIDACVSHSRDGIWGAQAVAVAISMAMVDAEMDQIMTEVYKVIPPNSWFAETMRRADNILKKADYDPFKAWVPLHDQLFCTYKSAVPEAITAAFAIVRTEHHSFTKGMMLGCNYGRDADTIGAVTGAILGAKLGAKAIPAPWMEKIRYPSGTCLPFTKGMDLFKVSEDLAALITAHDEEDDSLMIQATAN